MAVEWGGVGGVERGEELPRAETLRREGICSTAYWAGFRADEDRLHVLSRSKLSVIVVYSATSDVVKQHHTLTQIIMGLLNNGFELKVVEEADFLEEFDPRYNEEGVSELDEQFERLPDGHEAKRSYYLGFRQAQSEARPNIVISLLKLN